jgi:endoplasmic reticulum-Golgi intermediate compartment protein 3
LLLLSEFIDWRTITMMPSLQVDMARQERMEIHLDITFPRLPCHLVTVDVMDVAGEQQNDIEHTLNKTRLDATGKVIGTYTGQLGDKHITDAHEALNNTINPAYCGSCYGAPPPENGCCNTCQQVKDAYIRIKWSFSEPEKMEQCVREHWVEHMQERSHEGCAIKGWMRVAKLEGNLHAAPGKSFSQGTSHIHDIQEFEKMSDLDMSHTVHHLSFGPMGAAGKVPLVKNPLNGVSKHTGSAHYVYQYYLKVVSTQITYLDGSILNTNQYSVTEHEQDVSGPFGPRKVPGMLCVVPMCATALRA